MAAIAKFEYIRSEKLMKMYRTIPCQHCGTSAPTCGAHSNQQKHGKGKGIKASDHFAASMCDNCHKLCDYGLSRAESVAMWWKAHVKTVKALTSKFGDEYLKLVNYYEVEA